MKNRSSKEGQADNPCLIEFNILKDDAINANNKHENDSFKTSLGWFKRGKAEISRLIVFKLLKTT